MSNKSYNHPPDLMHAKRSIDSLDLLKLILSIFVVSIHTLGKYAGYPFVCVAVPIFFIISSYLFFSRLNGENDMKALKRFLLRNLRLYAFWFVLLLPIIIRGYLDGNILFNIIKLCGRIVFGSTFTGAWYISALCIGVLLVFFLKKYLNSNIILTLGLIFYVLCCLNSNYRGLFAPDNPIVQINILYPGTIYHSAPVGFFWVALGYKLSQISIEKIKNRSALICLTVSVLLLIAESVLIDLLECRVDIDCYFMLVPVAVSAFILAYNSKFSFRYAKLFRNMSTLIYCVHGAVAVTLMALFDMNRSWILFLLTLAICIVISSLILILERKKPFRWLKWSH